MLQFEEVQWAAGAGASGRETAYRVGVADQIEISVFGHDDLRALVDVRPDGTVNYPLFGALAVVDKTTAEIEAELTSILGENYLVDPQVSVELRASRSQWVTIFGEVRSPSRYVLTSNMRLVDLLAAAGGVTKEAGTRLLIRRRTGGENRQITVDLDDIWSAASSSDAANPILLHGDVINVSEKEVFYIRGQVNRPGSYLLSRNMTLLKAFAVAGGFGQFANRKQVELLRMGESGVEQRFVINVKDLESGEINDVPLEPDDTIIVPRRMF